MTDEMKSYKDLKVWSKGMDLAEPVYRSSRAMPEEEQDRMTSQMLRSAASVPANIAEGYRRATRKDYAHLVSIATGSLVETETFLLLASRVGLLAPRVAAPALALADELSRMLNVLRHKLTLARVEGSRPSAEPHPISLTPHPSHSH